MSKRKKLSCAIIGSGTLPVRCADALLAGNHSVAVVISPDEPLKNWAADAEISHLAFSANLAEDLRPFEFDYLLSVVNENILRSDVLSLPRIAAINYHDAPLPRYAGTHATSWALLNGETEHAVSWHYITDTVDAGDILERQTVAIENGDTSWTLNAKCYEAAAQSFARLIDALADGSVIAETQNPAGRTFFARDKKPANGGVILWNEPAEKIARTIRALNFGAHPNRLGTAKIIIGDEFFIATEIEVLGEKSKSEAGNVSCTGEDFLQISTADREVILRKLFAIGGAEISITKLAAHCNLREGEMLETLREVQRQDIEKLYKVSAPHERFWTERLIALEPSAIPFADQTTRSENGKITRRKIELAAEVQGFLREKNDWNTASFALAAFAVLLARLNGAGEFDLGYANAALKNEISGLANLFSNELPLRCAYDGRKSFRDFYAEICAETKRIEKRKFFSRDVFYRYPQMKKHREANTEFSLCAAAFESVEEIENAENLKPTAQLKLIVSENEPDALFWEFDSNVLSDECAEKLFTHFEILLCGIVAEPESEIGRLPILTDEERRKILFEWNATENKYPPTASIQQLFEAQVERTPNAAALICGAERISYRELNRRANKTANHLRKLGARPETLIGISLERSVDLIVGVLGILKAGAAYVPLDPQYPKERIDLMLADSNAPILLTTEKTLAGLKNRTAKVVCIDRDHLEIDRESGENPPTVSSPENLAYVIYTSGSTGKPKGVAIEHRSAIAFLYWALSVFSPDQFKGVLASTSVCFDLSVFEMFAPLACGGTIVLVENALRLADAPAKNEVTLINTVPSAMTELLRIGGVPSSVKTVNLAGEPLKTALVQKIYALGFVEKVYDLYGPTEDTTYSTFTLRGTGSATIGRPIDNTQAFILDAFLQPVPVGIAGELLLGGAGLARGYLNRPELTGEKFINNPFSTNKDARLYRTGDLARFNERGEIEYLGRIDHQVKIRGFRVELGEIETALAAHAQIRETVVVAREDVPGEKRLVAYFVPRKSQMPKLAELRDYLKGSLPDYMIPSAFVELENMPLTPNGKINRKELPAPAANRLDREREVVAHQDALEERLIKIWETILDARPIGTRDDFFELGGHSLQAVRMFAEIEKTFNVNIPLAALFQAGTIEKLAEVLRQDGWDAPESSLVPIQPDGAKPIFFCVHAKGGNVLFYRDLARRLGDDQPFYGIQARRLGGRQVGHDNLKEMAEFYIREIKTVQPAGPYFLGGSSFGGLAAFEMAQQLRASGEQVAMLALLDTGTPDYPKYLPETSGWKRKFYDIARRVEHHRDNLSLLSAKQKFVYAGDKLAKVRLKYTRLFRNAYKKAMRQFYSRTKGAAAIPKSYIQLEDQIWRAGQNYQPEIYAGDVTIFRATLQPLGIVPDETLGWREYVGGKLSIYDVPGHHGSIVVEPYVKTLAEKLKNCLEEIYGRESKTSERISESPKSRVRETVVGV